MLIRTTESICPICFKKIKANLIRKKDRVYMEKTCLKHGKFVDKIGKYKLLKRVEKYDIIGNGMENPRTEAKKGCPSNCGICPNHKSYTVLGIIDVTNRCNLRCPVCFADSATTGYIYEPTKEQIRSMLQNLRNNKPVPTLAIQYSGGEPTVREDLLELIQMAKSLGFDHVEVNTNGIVLFNKGPSYIKQLKEAGVDTFYLQFDGFGEEVYKVTRGVDLTEKKLKVVEYCREAGFKSVVLVVTLINGVNTNQVGRIIRYATKNSDVVRCVNFQPVSITGRMNKKKLKQARVTNSDLIELIEKQTKGEIKAGDFYPVPFVVSFARVMGAIKGKNYPEFTCHPYCGVATFVFVENGKIVPISKYVNLEKFEKSLRDVEKTAKNHKTIAKLKLLSSSIKNMHPKILWYLSPVLREGSYEALGKFMHKLVMIGSMHFMDAYNFDFERVQRCVIHYAIPDGRIIPFCTMNTFHRANIEKKFSKPLR